MKGGVRGKYVARLRKGSNLVLLEPEVAAAFPSAEAVNEALRGVLNTTRAVRGKYYRRLLKEGANVIVLDPDVAKAFRSSAAVNEALRSLLRISEATRRLTSRSSGRAASTRR